MHSKKYKGKTAQEIQDDIFRKMTADRKVATAAALWKFAKELNGNKINYASRANRPATTSRRYSKTS